ncbi:MAG: nitrous oxide-stimulated promoter family protein [Ruminococcaceae bacterium]|nr:nitrous oxide-stimulated promoter family protein [Oscillospiraceae bacterium]
MNKAGKKREREKRIVALMIGLYCRKKHGATGKNEFCPDCIKLVEYALFRIDRCPFMETKTFCSECQSQCYKKDMREKIRNVMRFSGPRMILYHPATAVRHMIKDKRKRGRK